MDGAHGADDYGNVRALLATVAALMLCDAADQAESGLNTDEMLYHAARTPPTRP